MKRRIALSTLVALLAGATYTTAANAEGGCPSTIAKPGIKISIETWNQLTVEVWTRATSPIETPNGPVYLNGQSNSHIYAAQEGGHSEWRFAENVGKVIWPKLNESYWDVYFTEEFVLEGPGVRFPPYAETIKGGSQHKCGVSNGTPPGTIWSGEAGRVWETP